MYKNLCVLKQKTPTKSSSIAVFAQWFWDSIRAETLLPIENYQLMWLIFQLILWTFIL